LRSRIIFVLLLIAINHLIAQQPISKESFFPQHKRLPKNFKTEIAENKWEYMGTYRSDNSKIILPDSPQPALITFEKGDTYRRIKGKKIVSNSKSDDQKIVYLDDLSLILEAKDEKGRYRSLYQKRKATKIKGSRTDTYAGKKQI
jgi:hypothetical protein